MHARTETLHTDACMNTEKHGAFQRRTHRGYRSWLLHWCDSWLCGLRRHHRGGSWANGSHGLHSSSQCLQASFHHLCGEDGVCYGLGCCVFALAGWYDGVRFVIEVGLSPLCACGQLWCLAERRCGCGCGGRNGQWTQRDPPQLLPGIPGVCQRGFRKARALHV